MRYITCRSVLLALVFSTACLPYSIGNTAQTVPEGKIIRGSTNSYAIGGGGRLDDSLTYTGPQNVALADQEIRFGISSSADIGVRVTSGSGILLNLKRRHSGVAHPDSAAFSSSIGAGIVNLGDHALLEGTLHFSGSRRPTGVPYGALKVMQTIPIERNALQDTPAMGLAVGWRFGEFDMGIIPELAIWYDQPVVGNRSGNWVVVPSVTLNGLGFLPRFFRR